MREEKGGKPEDTSRNKKKIEKNENKETLLSENFPIKAVPYRTKPWGEL